VTRDQFLMLTGAAYGNVEATPLNEGDRLGLCGALPPGVAARVAGGYAAGTNKTVPDEGSVPRPQAVSSRRSDPRRSDE